MIEAVLNVDQRLEVPSTPPKALMEPATESMKPANHRAWRRTAAAWLGVATVYWLGLFAGTHSPVGPTIPSSLWDFDKVIHAAAYFGLATVLLIAWRRTGAQPGLRGRLAIAAIALAYGAVDELTQPFVGRQCELLDWLADGVGVFSAVAIDTWRHRHRAPSALVGSAGGASL